MVLQYEAKLRHQVVEIVSFYLTENFCVESSAM